MPSESADQRFLLAREADLWHAEAERTQNRLDDPQQGSSEAEQAWYDYCFRKHEEVARELDKIENPQNIPRATSRGTKTLTISTAKQNETGRPATQAGRRASLGRPLLVLHS